jgi:hypothetical protein
MEDAELLIEKAAQCRRLASCFSTQSDPAIKALIGMAEEFEALVAATRPRSDDNRRG